MAKAALIVVDVQRDFCEGGALAAADTLSLARDRCSSASKRHASAECRHCLHTKIGTRKITAHSRANWRPVAGSLRRRALRGAELMPPLQARRGRNRGPQGRAGRPARAIPAFELTGPGTHGLRKAKR